MSYHSSLIDSSTDTMNHYKELSTKFAAYRREGKSIPENEIREYSNLLYKMREIANTRVAASGLTELSRRRYGGKGTVRLRSSRVHFPTEQRTARRRRSNGTTISHKLVAVFFELLLMVKLYHWNTYSYATHKATDDLHTHLSDNIDRFMEVYLGTHSSTLPSQRIPGGGSIRLVNLDDKKGLATKIAQFKSFLINNIKPSLGSDLVNIRDEILADINQFLYLLTLH